MPRRYVRIAGALALVSGSLLSGGVPAAAAASVAIAPMLHSAFGSAYQPLTPAECEAAFTAPCYGPDQLQAAYDEQPLFKRGITGKGFDGRGNFAMGVKEQIIFPEINYDRVESVRGMDIQFVTTAKTDAEAKALLKAFELPFAN